MSACLLHDNKKPADDRPSELSRGTRGKETRSFFAGSSILPPAKVGVRQHHAARKGDAPREDARLRPARCAEPGRLDARLSPRALRNPAPLARRPPVLTHPEGRRSR